MLTTRAKKRAARLRAITKERRERRRVRMMLEDAANGRPDADGFDIVAALKKLADKEKE